MTDDEDDDAELRGAHRSSNNAAVLTVISVAFGLLWLADSQSLPPWMVSVWFLLVRPLNLYLLFIYRRRYRLLRELHDGGAPGPTGGPR